MKKILLATTALAATSGVAMAEMGVSGSAEVGIFGSSTADAQFHTDVDVTFTGTGETDGGLAFGFSIDLDESDGGDSTCTFTDTDTDTAGGGTAAPLGAQTCNVNGDSDAFDTNRQGGETIFISGNFGTLTWGDTDGAFDWALQEVGIGGSIDDAHTAHAGFSGNSGLDGTYDGQIVRYDYSFSSFSIAGSVEMDDAGVGDPVFGVGAKFDGDFGGLGFTAGLGYQSDSVNDIVGVSLGSTFAGGFQAVVNYSDLDGLGGVETHWGLGVGYSMNALTVGFNYGVFDFGAAEDTGWGLAVDYDLGGGAELQFGYGTSDFAAGGTADQWSFGMAMSF